MAIKGYKNFMDDYEYKSNKYSKSYMKKYSREISTYSNTQGWSKSKSSSSNSLNKALKSLYLNENILNGQKTNYVDIPIDRSKLDRLFDAINVGQYAVQGGINSALNDENILEGVWKGIQAGNPFGDGKEKWEFSTSKNLEEMGWEPESKLGKFAKGTLGLAGDILLDPTTYATFGITGVFKGTGKAGQKVTQKLALKELANEFGEKILGESIKDVPEKIFSEVVEKLTSQGVAKEVAEKFAMKRKDEVAKTLFEKVGMSDDIAQRIVKRHADEYTEKTGKTLYESRKAFDDEAIRLKDKFNKLYNLGEKSNDITLGLRNMPFGEKLFPGRDVIKFAKGSTMSKLGDKTLAPSYNKIRARIVGGKIGKLFSPDHAIYKLAKDDPMELLRYLKSVDIVKGLGKGMVKNQKAIRLMAESLKNLEPFEQKQIIDLLEDEQMFKKVMDEVNIFEMDEVSSYITTLQKNKEDFTKKLSEIQETNRTAQMLDKKYLEDMFDLGDSREMLQREIREKVSELKLEHANTTDEVNQLLDLYKANRTSAIEQWRKVNADVPTKTLPTDSPKLKVEPPIKGKIVRSNKFESPKLLSGKNNVSDVDKFQRQTVEGTVNPTIEMLKKFDFRKTSTTLKTDKIDIINSISKHTFGTTGRIGTHIADADVKTLMKFVKSGKSKVQIAEHIMNNYSKYSPHNKDFFSYIAELVGYGNSWDEFYVKPMAEFKRLLDAGKTLSPSQLRHMQDLEMKNLKRTEAIIEISDKSPQEIIDLKTQLSNSKMFKEVDEVDPFLYSSDKHIKSKTSIFDEDYKRSKYIDDKEYLRNPKSASMDRIQGKNKLTVFDEFDYEKAKRFAVEDLVNMQKGKAPSKPQIDYINKVLEVYPVVLRQNFKNMNYEDLTAKQKNFLHNMSIQRVNKDMNDGITKGSKKEKFVNKITVDVKQKKTAKEFKYALQENSVVQFISKGELINGRIAGVTTDRVDGTVFKMVDLDGKIIDFVPAERVRQVLIDSNGEKFDGMFNDSSKIVQTFNERLAKVSPDAVNDVTKVTPLKKSDRIKKYVLEEYTDKFKVKNTEYKKGDVLREYKAKTNANRKMLNDLQKVINKTKGDITGIGKEYTEITAQHKKAITDTIRSYDDQFKKLDDTMKVLEGKYKDVHLNTTQPWVTELVNKKVKELDEAFASTEALETYIRTHIPMGEKNLEKLMNEKAFASGRIYLDDMDVSDKVKEMTKVMRQQFLDMGLEEVGINKLNMEQFEEMAFKYLTHAITPEGQKLLNKTKYVKENPSMFTDMYGFGKVFNEYGLSRTIKRIPDGNGGWIESPKISEINEFFKPLLKGKNFFSEDIADIYVARAMKHTELMYDNNYMKNMLQEFGSKIDFEKGFKKGYKPVANYGDVKDGFGTISSWKTSQHIKKEIQDYITSITTFEMDDIVTQSKKAIYDKEKVTQFINSKFTDEYRKGLTEKYLKETMDEVGFDSRLLDDYAVPMVELNEKQMKNMDSVYDVQKKGYLESINDSYNKAMNSGEVERAKKYADRIIEAESHKKVEFAEINEAIFNKMNQARKVQIAKDKNNFLKMYDKMTHLIKLNQTTIMPSFHMRNKMSNTYLNYLALGNDAFDTKLQRQAYRMIKSEGMDEVGRIRVPIKMPDGSKGAMSLSELFDEAKSVGVIDKGMYAVELGANSGTSGIFKGLNPKFNPTDTRNFTPYKKGAEFGSLIENQDRFHHFVAQIRNGKTISEAKESVDKFLFDYSNITEFEKTVMKRIIPYYTWMRKNGALQLSQMIEDPKKFYYVSKITGGIENMVNERDKINKNLVNDFASDWIQTPFSVTNPEGRKEPVLWNPNMPFMDVNRLPGINPIENAKLFFTQMNPLLKVPAELAMNRNVFFESPIAKEGDNKVAKYAQHIMSQGAGYNTLEGLVEKKGLDKALHIMNSTSGVKLLSYDYDKYSAMKIQELLDGKGVDEFTKEYVVEIIAVKVMDELKKRGMIRKDTETYDQIGNQINKDMLDVAKIDRTVVRKAPGSGYKLPYDVMTQEDSIYDAGELLDDLDELKKKGIFTGKE